MLHYNHDCIHTHTPLVSLDNRSNTVAIAGGVAGGLVVLGILSLLSSIVVAVKLRKRGRYSYIASYKHFPS